MTTERITTPFTATSTASEVIAGIDLSGKRAIVTGGASGIGVETARALAGAGAEVTIAVRNQEAGAATAADILATTGRTIEVAPLELMDRASVSAFVDSWTGPLHILVNNAGVMENPETRTAEGWESQFATNHLGHFALTTGLHGALAAADGARVVSVSSSGHLRSPIVFDDIMFERRAYDPAIAYGQSKTANVLFAVEASRRWAEGGITVNAVMPGGIRTPLQRHRSAEALADMEERARRDGWIWKTTEQGAATSVFVATSPLLAGIGGRYFEDVAEARPNEPGMARGVAAYALDPAAAERLWILSRDLLQSPA
jgi:NAD(P)-dependent dehydrogenase (short-subunit alcohol dehydrogenase family)